MKVKIPPRPAPFCLSKHKGMALFSTGSYKWYVIDEQELIRGLLKKRFQHLPDLCRAFFVFLGFAKLDLENKMEKEDRPRIGVGIMILKNNKTLLGKRKGSHGEGEYAFPGGHLEYMESFEDCAKRETKEETGIEIKNVRFQYLANVKKYAPKHYVHIGLLADYKSGEPQVLEPDKSENWGWYSLDELPGPLFEMAKLAIECYKKGKNYFDI